MKERKIECVREREREKKCVSETASFEERGGERMRVRERERGHFSDPSRKM